MSPKQLGLIRVAAGVGCLVGFPFSILLGAAYLATPSGADQPPAFAWDDALRETFPGLFNFAEPQTVYLTYGAFTPLAVAGLVAGLWLLHRAQRAAETKWARITFYAYFSLMAAFAVMINFSFYFDPAFFVALPALLLGLVAGVVYGVATLRMKVLPRTLGWLVLVAPLFQLPASIVLGHNSIGLWGFFVVGIWLARRVEGPVPNAQGPQLGRPPHKA